ncbi:VWA domain-containing protein [Aeoliella mucimassa]|uniref:von Willebrand factor type A domain protein n=1 Tax=Aeoliella mucimassa TaxID=2527972 RepID=A0A518AQC7_9BACT|nr:VWA domain-containing protein [Aeoliella mucimassa]QDU56928.1 von Willebrand factor type A domain protein [Aeoliella mucimassa]
MLNSMDIQIGNSGQLIWLWLPAVVVVAMVLAVVARKRARGRFVTANLVGRVFPGGTKWRNLLASCLVLLSMCLMVIALVDVRWGKVAREVPQKGIEVMFVLDVSRSMLAEDASPSRLARAKQQIMDVVDEMTGDRVGLVVFAGDAKQEIPLTTHYDDFKQSLEEVGPQSVRRGGSRLGEAIEVASESFLTKLNAHKAMVIITDGEDQQSDPVAIAKKVHDESGVRIFTIGLGDMNQGARIPVADNRRNTYVQYEGEQVWSKLNGDILRQVAVETEGAYIPAGTKQVNMSQVYHRYIASVEQTEFESATIEQYEARFQWLLAPALLLLLTEVVISTWPRRQVAQATASAAMLERAESSTSQRSSEVNEPSNAA